MTLRGRLAGVTHRNALWQGSGLSKESMSNPNPYGYILQIAQDAMLSRHIISDEDARVGFAGLTTTPFPVFNLVQLRRQSASPHRVWGGGRKRVNITPVQGAATPTGTGGRYSSRDHTDLPRIPTCQGQPQGTNTNGRRSSAPIQSPSATRLPTPGGRLAAALPNVTIKAQAAGRCSSPRWRNSKAQRRDVIPALCSEKLRKADPR
ncbi:hypothetical protein BC834DRAFT_5449 [Gloeopeniophorella convolvens]|nr:hypothetical protein BC834DRAFT_5449 [Gloeopeniophorella convolvens]